MQGKESVAGTRREASHAAVTKAGQEAACTAARSRVTQWFTRRPITPKDTTGLAGTALACSVTDPRDAPENARLTALISGRVQGVGFREFIRRNALDLGLSGTAENLDDGRVEVVAEGDREELELLLVRLQAGPVHAEVEDVEVIWGDAGGITGFYVY